MAAIFFIGGDAVGGATLLALAVLGSAWRAQVPERQVAGGYARGRGRIEFLIAVALFAIYLLVVALVVVARVHHWTRDSEGRVAVYSMTGLMFLLYLEMRRHGDKALDWLKGGTAERHVGQELEPLRSEGWEIVHDLKRDDYGNVDHIVWTDRAAYAIETKSGRMRRNDLGQARGNAAWTKSKFRFGWVTPILCIGETPEAPFETAGVWVMGPSQLRAWLLSRKR